MACSGEMHICHRTPIAKAADWTLIDAEARKRGERTGLDTLVVHALNDAYSMCGASCASKGNR